MTRTNTQPAVVALLMLIDLLGGCGARRKRGQALLRRVSPHKPRRPSPVETERITGKQWRRLESATSGKCFRIYQRFSRGGERPVTG